MTFTSFTYCGLYNKKKSIKSDDINQTRLEGGGRMWKNMIKAAIAVISTGCAGYLIAAGLFVTESKEEVLQAFRYEKDGEVVYTSRTEPEHIRTDGATPSAYADNELIVQLAEGTSEREAKSIAGENQAELVGFISITDKDINITKPVLDLENSMKQAKRYV